MTEWMSPPIRQPQEQGRKVAEAELEEGRFGLFFSLEAERPFGLRWFAVIVWCCVLWCCLLKFVDVLCFLRVSCTVQKVH